MNDEKRVADLALAERAVDARDPDTAFRLASAWAEKNMNDAEALYWVGAAAELGEKLPIAYLFAKRATELRPEKYAAWILLGHVCGRMWLLDEAERCSRRALRVAGTSVAKSTALTNLGTYYINAGEFTRGRPLVEEALALDPKNEIARGNLGLCLLAAREWATGWDSYAHTLGFPFRRKIIFGREPLWDGTKGFKVVLWGEQGLGDEISFASMIPDAIRDCERVILDADPRLKGLFQRSFPQAKVYGTRKLIALTWDKEDQDFHASAPFGHLGGIYRTKDSDFDGKPYLTPDPVRLSMWRSRWESLGRRAIGIAWTGGTERTASRYREWSLEDMAPILEAIPAHWVCLQYKDSAKEIAEFLKDHPSVDLVQYPFATLTPDYDDTAALVASLSCVISMQTAVVHLAGALGIPCDVFVPKTSQWRYGEKWETMPWYQSVKVIRQTVRGHWSNAISDYAEQLSGNAAARAA